MSEIRTTKTQSSSWLTYPPVRNAALAGVLVLMAIVLRRFDLISHAVEIGFYIIAIILGGYFWIREGVEELWEDRRIDIEILMLAATAGAAALGLWEEAALLVVIYGTAEGLESYTFARTRASIRALLDLAPKEAHLLRDGKEQTVLAADLQIGDIFLVRPGEAIATDGEIVRGKSYVNESSITGESIPVSKSPGQAVYAATLNQQGVLEVRVTATFADNTLSKIVHLVEEAQDKKSKAQAFIEHFGRRYSPIVLIVAIGLLTVSFLLGGDHDLATRAVVFLVAAAPCALVMSTPVAIAAGIGSAGKNGVLIKGGMHLENLGKITAIAFDKTGTLTIGKPSVTDIVPANGTTSDVLRLAYGVEQYSEHPLATAINDKAASAKLKRPKATNFKALSGSGAQANVAQSLVRVGRPELFARQLANSDLSTRIHQLRNEGKTVVCVADGDALAGIIAIRDQIRPQAKAAIAELHKMDIATIMLTGDNEITAKAIAEELGVKNVKASLKPEDKVTALIELKKEYLSIAMIGDGVNDAPALATATVGMAMGTVGSDAAIEAADVALMADDLNKVVYALKIGKDARSISRQNIVFSLLILAALIPSALLGVMTVAVSVVIHEVSELLAVSNGLRVRRSSVAQRG